MGSRASDTIRSTREQAQNSARGARRGTPARGPIRGRPATTSRNTSPLREISSSGNSARGSARCRHRACSSLRAWPGTSAGRDLRPVGGVQLVASIGGVGDDGLDIAHHQGLDGLPVARPRRRRERCCDPHLALARPAVDQAADVDRKALATVQRRHPAASLGRARGLDRRDRCRSPRRGPSASLTIRSTWACSSRPVPNWRMAGCTTSELDHRLDHPGLGPDPLGKARRRFLEPAAMRDQLLDLDRARCGSPPGPRGNPRWWRCGCP